MLVKSTLFAAAMAAVVRAQTQPQINTPTALFTCQPFAVTWSGGQPPYFVTVVPGGNPGAAPLESLGEQPTTATSYTWNVNLAAGTSVTLSITDNQGITQNSAPVTILAGANTSCVGQPLSGASGATSSGAASSAASSSAASSASGASSVASSASSAASSAASSVSTAVSAATSSAASAASSAASSATGGSATGSAAPAASSRPASAGNKVGYSAAALVGAAAVVMIGA